MLLFCGFNDFVKAFGLHGGAADEAAIDIGLAKEFAGVVGFDGAAVEDSDKIRCFGVGDLCDFGANHGANTFGFRSVAGLSGADCPNRFVGDDEAVKLGGVNILEGTLELGGDDFISFASFALGEGFADAKDGCYSLEEEGFELEVNGFVGFGEEADSGFGNVELAEFATGFAVTDDAEIDMEFGELGGADLTCKGATIEPETVLGSEFDA